MEEAKSIDEVRAERALQREAKKVADDAEELGRDVQRGAARVLNAVSKGAKKVSREVQPSAAGTAKDVARSARRAARNPAAAAEEANFEIMTFVREKPWTTLALAAAGGALIATLLRLRR